MTPAHSESLKNSGKLGRNPFASATLKVGVKAASSRPGLKSADSSRKTPGYPHEPPSSDGNAHWMGPVRGVGYLLEGALLTCAKFLIETLHRKMEA